MLIMWDHCGIWQWLTQSELYRVTSPTPQSGQPGPACRQTGWPTVSHCVTLYYNEATWHKFCSVTNFQSRWNARYHLSKLARHIVIIVWQDYLTHEAMQNKTEAMIVSQLPFTNLPILTMKMRMSSVCSASNFHWGLMSDVPVFITSVALCALYWRIQLISLSSLSSPQKINNNYNTEPGQPASLPAREAHFYILQRQRSDWQTTLHTW